MQERSSIQKCKESLLRSVSLDCWWKIAAKKKLPRSSRCCSPLSLPYGTKTQSQLHKKRSLHPLSRGSRLRVSTSGSFAYYHFQLYYINQNFFLAFGAKKRELHQNRIRIYLGSCFPIANGATHPQGIVSIVFHLRTSDLDIALRSTSGFTIFLYQMQNLSSSDLA